MAGRIATWTPKNRVSVRAGHVRAAAHEVHDGLADDRRHPRHVRADARGEERQLVPREQVAAEAEGERDEEHQHAGQPRELARTPVRVQEHHAEKVREGRGDHQVGRPRVNRPHEPAERHARHDERHALVGLRGARPVVEQQQRAGDDLDEEEEQRHAAEEIPDREPMLRDRLVPDRVHQCGRTASALRARTCSAHHAVPRDDDLVVPDVHVVRREAAAAAVPATLRPFRS